MLVAKDNKQLHHIDCYEIFWPLEFLESIQILLAIVDSDDQEILQINVKATFLNGFLEKNVYMLQLKGF